MVESGGESSRVRYGVLFAFFLSGTAALLYQVLWTRQLSLVFGVTVYAASTVLACFMGGLALGSYLAGRVSDRVERPVRVFALVELLIGLTALITPFALGLVEMAYVALGPTLGDSPILKTIARVMLTSLVLIIPAGLMGSTYPLLLRAASRTRAGLSTSAAVLYGINTAGAITGVLAGSLWLLPLLGMRQSYIAAATINFIVAGLAFLISRAAPAAAAPDAVAAREAAHVAPLSLSARRLVFIVMAASGLVSLALEIIWFRILVFFLRPTTYAFASMLAAVLLGVALGSLIATPLLKRRANWMLTLGVLELLISVAALLSLRGIVASYDVLEKLWELPWLSPPYDYVLPLLASAAAAILPTALLLGAAFPIGVVLWSQTGGPGSDDKQLGRRIGSLYAGNVGGAILGSLAAGFLLIPFLGARHSLLIVSLIPFLGGAAVVWLSGAGTTARVALIGAAAIAFAAAGATLPDAFTDIVHRRYAGQTIKWHREDPQATVTVTGSADSNTLLIDGMSHAGDDSGSVLIHRAIGLLGLAVHPQPKNILVVGAGGGATAGAASILPGSRTTVVELSPSVVAANQFFASSNYNLLQNPQLTFAIDDGRNYLQMTPNRFDVVTADLILPHLAGAGSLYSSDYFALVRRALAPGGVMVQWLSMENDHQYKLMLRTFVASFPHVTLWAGGALAVGSNEPIKITREDFERKLQHAPTAALLAGNGIGTYENLKAAYFCSNAEIARFIGPGEILTDDLPIIEYFLSMPKTGKAPDIGHMRGPTGRVFVQ
jgi:spermidine synthase